MTDLSIIKPKYPKGNDWISIVTSKEFALGYDVISFTHLPTGIFVMSAVEVAVDTDGSSNGPEYHLSISKDGGRCTSDDATWVLKQFDLEGAEEDNHLPNSIARNFWRPVNESLIGHQCPCKESETEIKEDKGDYIWRAIND